MRAELEMEPQNKLHNQKNEKCSEMFAVGFDRMVPFVVCAAILKHRGLITRPR